MTDILEFPQYRKYKNGKSVFKISSPSTFTEIQVIGSNAIVHTVEAKILPDRNYINDMLYAYEANWDEITAIEYANFEEKLKLKQ